jgi:hypothetical protein
MGAAEIITIITSVIQGLVRVTKVTREALAKSLESMAADVRAGGLVPDQLLAKVESDGAKLDAVRDRLPK